MSSSTEPEMIANAPLTVVVSVDLCTNGYGNSGSYNVLYDGCPELLIDIVKPDLPITFRLESQGPTPHIYFVGITRKVDGVPTQLHCDISLDRQQLTWTDKIDNGTGDLNVTLHWIAGTPIWHDPQVRNKPT
jgi:hypothetical protein